MFVLFSERVQLRLKRGQITLYHFQIEILHYAKAKDNAATAKKKSMLASLSYDYGGKGKKLKSFISEMMI